VLDDAAVLDELARARAVGLAIGFTTTGPNQRETIERALELEAFDTVQSTWNVLERSAGPALAAAHDAGLGVIIKEALANGRLTARGDVPALIQAAERISATPDALAIAVVLAQPWVDVALSGATTSGQVTSNLSAAEIELEEELSETLASLREDPTEYWEHRAELPWN
jgi:aryl-alcohol dehydrogenase-like predicted oxidoreductase